MTVAEFNEFVHAATPLIDRALTVGAAATALVILWRLPWGQFWHWLSAPTMGSLVFVSAFCISAQSALGAESMYKYCNPYLLELGKFVFGTFGNGFIALKAYRMIPEKTKPDDPEKDKQP